MRIKVNSNKLSFVNFSDIHFKEGRNPLLNRTDAIARAIANCPEITKELIIIWSGDIAQGGKVGEYDVAEIFYTDVSLKLMELGFTIAGNIAVPGNHDVSMGNDARLDAADKINKQEISASRVNACIEAQDNYFSFARRVLEIDISDDEKLYKQILIATENKEIIFHCFNTSWLSRLGGELGKLIILTDKIDINYNTYDFAVSTMHHPVSWMNPHWNKRAVKELIESISDLVITGHEHESYEYGLQSDRSQSVFLEAGSLQDWANVAQSNFRILNIDLDTRQVAVYSCDFSKNIYHSKKKFTFLIDRRLINNGNDYSFNKEFHENLSPIPPGMGNLSLPISVSDLYQPQDLLLKSKQTGKEDIVIKSSDVFSDLIKREKVLLSGDSKSGKTFMLLEYMQYCVKNGIVPLYVNLENVNANSDRLNLDHIVKHAVETQYSKGVFESFRQLRPEERVFIIDNSTKAPEKFISMLIEAAQEKFQKVLIASTENFGVFSDTILENFDIVSLLPLNRRQRRAIIDKLAYYYASPQATDGLNAVETELNRILTFNNLPGWPIYVILICNSLFISNKGAESSASLGHLYEILIDSNTIRAYPDLDEYHLAKRILSILSYQMYQNDSDRISREKVEKLCEDYDEIYDTEIDVARFLENMYAAGILRKREGEIVFSYPAYYHYFVARYINDLSESQYIQEINWILSDIGTKYKVEVLLFLAYSSKDEIVLDKLVSKLSDLFYESEELDINEDFKQIEEHLRELPKLVYEQSDPKTNLKLLRDSQDELEENARKSWVRYESKKEDFKTDYDIAFKILEVIGELLRGKASNIPSAKKMDVAEKSFAVVSRAGKNITNVIIYFLEEVLPKMAEAYAVNGEFTAEQKNDLIKRSRKSLAFMNQIVMYAFVRTTSRSLGYANLQKTYSKMTKLDSEGKRSLFLIAIKLHVSVDQYPFDDVKQVFEQYRGNSLVKDIIQWLVYDFVLYKNLKAPDIQRALSDVDIKYKPNLHARMLN